MFIAALAVCGLLIGCHKDNNPVEPPPTLKPLELIYPKGAESLKVDSTVVVQWRINDTTKISSVMAKLSTNNGVTYDVVITSSGSVFPPQTSVSWTITSGQVSAYTSGQAVAQCKMEIFEYGDPSINDKSGTFTVRRKPLELLYPKGGESLKVDSTVVVQWRINDSTKVSSVVATLSTNNGVTYDTVITKSGSVFPPQTSVSWTILGPVSDSCKIKISENNDPLINDNSGRFTVHN
jgi:hypothetical protein